MNRCPICRGAVVYQGGRVARDPDTDKPHACVLPSPPRALLCACGLLVSILGDGSRIGGEGHDHIHELRAPQSMEQRIDEPPHPADTETPPMQQRGSAMPATPTYEGFTTEIIIDSE